MGEVGQPRGRPPAAGARAHHTAPHATRPRGCVGTKTELQPLPFETNKIVFEDSDRNRDRDRDK